MGSFSLIHWLLFGLIGVLLFGKRLPEVGRYLGKTIIEFKKGMKGLEDGLEEGTSVPLTLRFEKAGEIKTQLEVRPLTGGESHTH